jgi:uncharacterized ferritin-like protein (DUF455 family)
LELTPPSIPAQALFADGPARDARFIVKERWIDCQNLPTEHPLALIEFLHRQMNEEINSLESSARSLSDFPAVDWEIRMWLARQCADEARHVAMFRRLMQQRGGYVGQFPVLNFQYRIITRINNLLGRLAVQNRSFEAGGIDAIAFGIEEAGAQGDAALAELYEAQLADEISHVRFANEWIHRSTRESPRGLLQIGAALRAASQAFLAVMGKEGTEGVSYPADWAGRLEAGFSPDEIKVAADLASPARPEAQPDAQVE